MPAAPPFVIISGLDGTLLDDESNPDLAYPALERAQDAGIPIIFCSSKTRAEQDVLRVELGVTAPYVIENGAAVIIPHGTISDPIEGGQAGEKHTTLELGAPVADIRAALRAIREAHALTFEYFAEMSLTQLTAITGMTQNAAARAATREYSEVISTPPDLAQLAILRDALRPYNMRLDTGGRLNIVTGTNTDKGRAVTVLSDLLRREYPGVVTIGIGDRVNDDPLLSAVDRAYQVQRPGGVWVTMTTPEVNRVAAVGPEGWRRVVDNLLDEVG